ncbi:MAG: hypothetical protein LPK23_10035 [Rhodococcus sp. (in: high G+C Gram-positive bacteria)]|nr:hypothetical protein [Rhodococcus sp. (in: high G+C Gram-positive bacteria)]MDX5454078.1 hypothetical protein [Rhodococcus sp. (in: high G+C Gram-positive bacteria)]
MTENTGNPQQYDASQDPDADPEQLQSSAPTQPDQAEGVDDDAGPEA